MEDPTTIAMNLTYFATLGIGVIMFVGVFLAFVVTLLLAGLGRLVATAAAALATLFRGLPGRAPGTFAMIPLKKAVHAVKPSRMETRIAPEWAAAVERADARASARAKRDAAPEVRVSVRELPSPEAPAHIIKEVGPLIESATDRNGRLSAAPRAFTKLPDPAKSPILDTGSLTTLKHQAAQQSPERKAS